MSGQSDVEDYVVIVTWYVTSVFLGCIIVSFSFSVPDCFVLFYVNDLFVLISRIDSTCVSSKDSFPNLFFYSTLSMIGSLFIIISFVLFKDFQTSQSRRLLVLLSLCDLGLYLLLCSSFIIYMRLIVLLQVVQLLTLCVLGNTWIYKIHLAKYRLVKMEKKRVQHINYYLPQSALNIFFNQASFFWTGYLLTSPLQQHCY